MLMISSISSSNSSSLSFGGTKSDLLETNLGSWFESKKYSRKRNFLLNSFKSVLISVSSGLGVGVKEKRLNNNLTLAKSNGKLVKSSTLRVVLLYKGSLTTRAFVSFLTDDYWIFPVECYFLH